MENNNQDSENRNEETNQNANSAYSGSGSMQPGGNDGQAGSLNDYSEEVEDEKQANGKNDQNNPEGKSIDEATDPSKLSKL